MSAAQHTPGPWHPAGDQGVQIRSEKHQIAKVWTMRGNEWKANAHLIAAAPELLEALKLCEGNISSLLASTHPRVYGEWLDFVRAAIAKATGGAA